MTWPRDAGSMDDDKVRSITAHRRSGHSPEDTEADRSRGGLPEDLALVAAAREGDRAAFEELYRRYARMVHGIVLARVPREEADDIVQDVFIVVLRRIPDLRDDGSFGGWLAAIARNQARDFHRRAPRETELPDDLPGGPAADGEAEWILEIIRGLPDAYRETLIMRLVEGMTGPEIAERTGLTAGSVRVNLHRGMKQLREKLAGRTAP